MIIDEAESYGITLYLPEAVAARMRVGAEGSLRLESTPFSRRIMQPGWWEHSHVAGLGMPVSTPHHHSFPDGHAHPLDQ